jgi:hypothetical protein
MSSGSNSDGVYNEVSNVTPGNVINSTAKVSVCYVQAPPIPLDTVVQQGTADLYEVAEGVFTVATNNHVIPITDSDSHSDLRASVKSG